MEGALELTLGALVRDGRAVHLNGDTAGGRDGPLADSGHCWPPLPDEGDELAAELGRPRIAVGHEPLRRGHDRHAEAVLHPRDLPRLHAAPEAGLRDALELTHARHLIGIL